MSGTLSHQWAREFLLIIGFMAGITEKFPTKKLFYQFL
jgi:hypothetical protein